MERACLWSPATLALLLVLHCCHPKLTSGAFNVTTCPSIEEVWALNRANPHKVPCTFDLQKFAPEGTPATYYELAFHDWTQKPACPDPRCVSSTKVFDRTLKQINDSFALECVGRMYHPALRFHFTDTPGKFLGWWSGFPLSPQRGWIPNAVVDFEVATDGGSYDWVIEFQCVEQFRRVLFVGLNFYSRHRQPGPAYVRRMLDVARTYGLGVYMDTGPGVTIVDHGNCPDVLS
eukprot:EG_transcript_20408